MREILFRGKRCHDGRWVDGNLFLPDLPDAPTQILMGTNAIRIAHDIIPSTVGQYTGLKDKNGKRIFEGDIISIRFENDCEPGFKPQAWYENASVFFSVSRHEWCVLFTDGTVYNIGEYDDCDDVTVVGNIYDNPELLEVER